VSLDVARSKTVSGSVVWPVVGKSTLNVCILAGARGRLLGGTAGLSFRAPSTEQVADALVQVEHGIPVLETSHRTLRLRQRWHARGALLFSMATGPQDPGEYLATSPFSTVRAERGDRG
jgi:hypothetical protein